MDTDEYKNDYLACFKFSLISVNLRSSVVPRLFLVLTVFIRGYKVFQFASRNPQFTMFHFFSLGNPFSSRRARYAWAQSRASFLTRAM